MKAYIIKASSGSEFSKYKAKTGGPPQNIFSTAACTPSDVEIELCDETIGMKTNLNTDADIIAIFMSTPDANRAYEIADKLRAKDKTVILGGLHTKFMQAEALSHADSLLIGEVEEIWENLLRDYKNGQLKKIYQRTNPLDLVKLNPYPTNLIPPKKYNYIWSVVVSRGCIHNCDFCLVPKFSGKYRLRPIKNIVEEVKQLKKLGVKWVELHSDTLTANREYIIDLLNALAPLKMNFFGETTILVANDTELLKVAQKSGLKALLIGIETPSLEALKAQRKGFVHPNLIKKYITTIKKYGIEVWGDFLFGFDEHDSTIFQQTYDFINEIKVDESFPHLVIPFPGSDTYKRLESENRILTKDWSKYDGIHSVFKPSKLTPKELEEGLYWIWNKQNSIDLSLRNILKTKPQNNEHINKTKHHSANILNYLNYWRSLLAIITIIIGFIFNFYWIWGLFFLMWVYTDLKNGYTYLMDLIPRKEAPMLYWIVLTMWLFFAITSFFPGFMLQNNTENLNSLNNNKKISNQIITDDKDYMILTNSMQTDTKAQNNISSLPNLTQIVTDDIFDYQLNIPENWTYKKQNDKEMQYLIITDPERFYNITLLSIFSLWKFSLNDLEHEIESSKEMEFFDFTQKKPIDLKPQDSLSADRFRAYKVKGVYQNINIDGLLCYKTKNKFGYSFIAIYPADDYYSFQLIYTILKNIKFTNK